MKFIAQPLSFVIFILVYKFVVEGRSIKYCRCISLQSITIKLFALPDEFSVKLMLEIHRRVLKK